MKYGEEWMLKIMLQPEERILINPLDPIYKKLLERAEYSEENILEETERRLEGHTEMYNPPEKEVLYQLFPLVAVARRGSHSREASLVIKMLLSSVKERLHFALGNLEIEKEVVDSMREVLTVEYCTLDLPREDMFRLVSGNDTLRYMVLWSNLSDYDLTHYYMVDGWVPVTRTTLIEVYTLLLGRALKEYIETKKEEYSSQEVRLPPIFSKILQMISSKVPSVAVAPTGAAELEKSAFPPCVREALQGASSGLRNYAVTVLLTSFLSYARIYPSMTAFDQEKKPELSPEQIDILLEEVVPLIFEAGSRCDPPLFTDQPIERSNVFYHLGFGLSESPRPQDFGSSKWYLPPSCKKMKQNAPPLCKPDELCSQGIYAVADKDGLRKLAASSKGESQKILEALEKTRNPQRIAELSGIDVNEVKRVLQNLQREGILIQIQIKNPLTYYLRKIRKKVRRQKQE